MHKDIFQIGRWQVDPAANMISSGKEQIRLQPRFMRVLALLAEREGTVLTRDELLAKGWPEVVVQESALTQAISHLRTTLGPIEGAYIQTIPKVGYRIDIPVVEDSSDTADSVASLVRWVRYGLMSLGVLAFVGLIVSLGPFGSSGKTELTVSRVTSAPGQELSPAINRDGTQVVYSKWMPDTGQDLLLQDLETGRTTHLTDASGHDVNPIWSPDGNSVLFVRKEMEGCEIILIDVNTGAEEWLHECAGRSWPTMSWSPSGEIIAVSTRPSAEEDYEISVFDAETFVRLAGPFKEEGIDYRRPVFIDDNQIGFAAYEEGYAGSIRRIRLDDGKVERLFRFEGPISGLAFESESGKFLVSGENDVFRSDFQGQGSWQRVHATAPSADGTGNRVVYTQWQSRSDIYQLDLRAGGQFTELIASTQVDRSPKWSHKADRIAFVSNRTGSAQLWIAQSDGTDPRRVTGEGNDRIENFDWSPDDKQVVFVGVTEGLRSLIVLDISSGRKMELVGAALDPQSPSWSADGLSILFRGGADDARTVMRASVDEGSVVRLGLPQSSFAVQTGDGRVYFTRSDTTGVWTMKDQSPRLVLNGMLDDFRWTVVDSMLYFLRDVDGLESVELAVLNLNDNTIQSVSELPRLPGRGRSLDISADKTRALFVMDQERESDIIMLSVTPAP